MHTQCKASIIPAKWECKRWGDDNRCFGIWLKLRKQIQWAVTCPVCLEPQYPLNDCFHASFEYLQISGTYFLLISRVSPLVELVFRHFYVGFSVYCSDKCVSCASPRRRRSNRGTDPNPSASTDKLRTSRSSNSSSRGQRYLWESLPICDVKYEFKETHRICCWTRSEHTLLACWCLQFPG